MDCRDMSEIPLHDVIDRGLDLTIDILGRKRVKRTLKKFRVIIVDNNKYRKQKVCYV